MTAPTPSRFFAEAQRRFAEAVARAPGGEIDVRLAGRHIRLRFAGDTLRSVVAPVFAHLPRAGAGDADLTIALWDTRTTGIGMPPRPWQADDHGSRGLIRHFSDERFATRFDLWSGALSMLDGEHGQAIHWVPDAAGLPHWERAHPLSALIARWFQDRDLPMLHAGAIGRPDGGVLLVGRGGSGKSTSVLAGIAAGLRTAGDDYLLVDCKAAVAHGLYGSATLHADHRRRFPSLMPAAETQASAADKSVTLLAVHRPASLIAALPLVAIVVPRVVGRGPCRIHPATAAQALRALAPSTLLQVGHADAAGLARLAALCRGLPCFALDLGAEPADIPAAIVEILDRGAGRAAMPAAAR